MDKRTQRSIAWRARRFFKALEDGKDKYSRADRLMKEIRSLGMQPGDRVPINAAGDKVCLNDLYADADKVFRSHGIGRFELKLEKAAQ